MQKQTETHIPKNSLFNTYVSQKAHIIAKLSDKYMRLYVFRLYKDSAKATSNLWLINY